MSVPVCTHAHVKS